MPPDRFFCFVVCFCRVGFGGLLLDSHPIFFVFPIRGVISLLILWYLTAAGGGNTPPSSSSCEFYSFQVRREYAANLWFCDYMWQCWTVDNAYRYIIINYYARRSSSSSHSTIHFFHSSSRRFSHPPIQLFVVVGICINKIFIQILPVPAFFLHQQQWEKFLHFQLSTTADEYRRNGNIITIGWRENKKRKQKFVVWWENSDHISFFLIISANPSVRWRKN